MEATKKTGATVYIESEYLSITLADLYLTIAKYCILEKIQQGLKTIDEIQKNTKIPIDELTDLIIELNQKKIINIKNNYLSTNYNPPPRKTDTVLVLQMIKLRNCELSYGQIAKKTKRSRQEVADILTYLLDQKNIPEKTQKAFSRKQQVESIKINKNEKSKQNYQEFHLVP